MTRQDVAKAIEATLGEIADRGSVAQTIAEFAIAKLGRMPGVDFNRKWKTFTLTSGTSSYTLGEDLFAGEGKIFSVSDMWRTDTSGWGVTMVSTQRFNAYARGTTTLGAPELATVYGPPSDRTLEFYPIPNSAYTMGCMVEFQVSGIDQIPDRYWDVVYSTALDLLAAAKNPSLAARLAIEGMRDIQRDGVLASSPTTIHATRTIDTNSRFRSNDSGSLR